MVHFMIVVGGRDKDFWVEERGSEGRIQCKKASHLIMNINRKRLLVIKLPLYLVPLLISLSIHSCGEFIGGRTLYVVIQ